MTRAIFTAATLTAWFLSLAAVTDPYWPNDRARVEAMQLQSMVDGLN
ncbi:MAG: hypothetical protein ACR2P3_14875 [Geminicoccaceae bacterium]